MGSTDRTCIARPPGALQERQTPSLRLNLTSGKQPQRALGDVPSEVLTEEGKAPGLEEGF